MTPVELSGLLDAIGAMGPAVTGPRDTPIQGLTDDSREVRPGWLFAAHRGEHTDGHRYVAAAIGSGAVAILHQDDLPPTPGVTLVRVADVPAALSRMAARFHGDPSRSMVCLGVTGTKGKTTTTWFLTQLLAGLGRKVGMVSSALTRVGGKVAANPGHVSTPMAVDLHGLLRRMRDAGDDTAVIETSSHGLSERTSRVRDVFFDAAVLTNITHEHLDFHGTFEQYRSDKANLFRALGREAGRATEPFGVVNADDPSAEYIRGQTRSPVLSYSVTGAPADMRALEIRETGDGSSFTLVEGGAETGVPARLATPGRFNLENLLAALAAARRLTGTGLEELAALVPGLTPVKGRMERIAAGQPFEVVVDFAHNPDSFEKLLSTMRRLARARMIVVFGSGGERDRAKRPLQGEIAGRYCEVVVLADEDPRGESPRTILREIAAGCGDHVEGQDLFLIPERVVAIRHAFRLAQPGDTVLLLGKGHETSILYAGYSIPWDEAAVARRLLAEMGYRG